MPVSINFKFKLKLAVVVVFAVTCTCLVIPVRDAIVASRSLARVTNEAMASVPDAVFAV